MTDDIVNLKDFRKKIAEHKHSISDEMFNLTMHMDNNGEFEVYMEVNDMYTDMEIFEAMMAAGSKFAMDHNLVEMELELEQEPANDS